MTHNFNIFFYRFSIFNNHLKCLTNRIHIIYSLITKLIFDIFWYLIHLKLVMLWPYKLTNSDSPQLLIAEYIVYIIKLPGNLKLNFPITLGSGFNAESIFYNISHNNHFLGKKITNKRKNGEKNWTKGNFIFLCSNFNIIAKI